MMEPGDIVASMHKPPRGIMPIEPSYSELERVNKVLLSRCDFLEKRLVIIFLTNVATAFVLGGTCAVIAYALWGS